MRVARRTARRPDRAGRGEGHCGFTLVEGLLGIGLLALSAVGVALSAGADRRCQAATARAAELERDAARAADRIHAICTAPGVVLLAPAPGAASRAGASNALALLRRPDPAQGEVELERIELCDGSASCGAAGEPAAVWVRSGASGSSAIALASPVGGTRGAPGAGARSASDDGGLRFEWHEDYVACRVSLAAVDALGRQVVRSAETLIPLPRTPLPAGG